MTCQDRLRSWRCRGSSFAVHVHASLMSCDLWSIGSSNGLVCQRWLSASSMGCAPGHCLAWHDSGSSHAPHGLECQESDRHCPAVIVSRRQEAACLLSWILREQAEPAMLQLSPSSGSRSLCLRAWTSMKLMSLLLLVRQALQGLRIKVSIQPFCHEPQTELQIQACCCL